MTLNAVAKVGSRVPRDRGRAGRASLLAFALCAFNPAANAFEYSQFSPKGAKFAPPDTNRIAEIAAHLPEKPGWYRKIYCTTARARELLAKPIPQLTEEDYMLFFKTGDRHAYENKSSALRGMLAGLVSKAAMRDGSQIDRGAMLKRISDILEVYVNLRSWTFPAHDPKHMVWDGKANRIDLTSADVSANLALAILELGDELDAGLVARVRVELERRTFSSYLHSAAMTSDPRFDPAHMNHWFYIRDNWNTVCHCGCVTAALAVIPDRKRRAAFVEAAERAMPHYLKGFYDDGYCFEGAGYWDYGYGNFLRLTDTVRNATGGFVDFSRLPRAKKMMEYGFTAQMDGKGKRPRFADSSGGRPSPQWIELGVKLWPDLKPLAQKALPLRTWFPEAQVYIGRGAKFSFAIKGGQNDLPHCHRDLGSWVILFKDKYVAGDPGTERYTRRTFSAKRFDSNILNSYGHPVPRVGGELQAGGKSAQAKVLGVEFTDECDTLRLDLTDGYPCLRNGGGSLVRTVTFDRAGGKVSIRDDFRSAKPRAFDSPVVTELPECPLAAELVTGGAWHMDRDDIENPGYPTQHRHSVTFDVPVTAASVTWTFKGE